MSSNLKNDTAKSAVDMPILMVAVANFGLVNSNGPPGGIVMRLGIPLIVFSLCMLAGYAEARSQSKRSPNGFAPVDKSGNIS
jgi:hypothetical protein